MKLTMLNCSMLIAGFSAIGLATVSLDPLPLQLYAGDTQELSWTTDRDYHMELLLVRRYETPDQSGWNQVKTVFENRAFAKGSGGYDWIVPNVEYRGSYALWLSGGEYSGGGYSNLTNWFEIESPANSSFLPHLSFGEIVGVVAGALAALLMGAAAIVIMLRLTRNTPETKRPEVEEVMERDSFDSILDEKVKAEYRSQLY